MTDDKVIVRFDDAIDKFFAQRVNILLYSLAIADDLLDELLDCDTMIALAAGANLCALLLDPLRSFGFRHLFRDAIKDVGSSVPSRGQINPANRLAGHTCFVGVTRDLIRRFLSGRE